MARLSARAAGDRRAPSRHQTPWPVPRLAPLDYAADLIHRVCRMAGDASLLDEITIGSGLSTAIRRHDTPAIFDWLMSALSYQGISDRVARGYMERHGQATWAGIEAGLSAGGRCAKLHSYWRFEGCRYDKGSRTCAEPDHIAECPLPRHDLRNGRLNQTAFSLFLFSRDVADGDIVAWLDSQLIGTDDASRSDRIARMRDAAIGPFRHVYGVADKTLAMALSGLLLKAPPSWTRWHEVGGSMIAIDTLVHNFLHRTGILRGNGAEHLYGPACYRLGGCAEILERVAALIDARQFNPTYPARFPRFVQHAIWRYCAQDGLAVCNGNRIDDGKCCQNNYCRLFSICERIPLN